ncbi:MAG: GerMN domain-containing protein [Spirochaetes bacterium]|jgi:hypothetical protein|nr:GerMN domain-containing protein [Spirochaetota bacterium]
MKIVLKIKEYRKLIRRDSRERNRFLLLAVSLMLILNYSLYCLHVDKNIFDIFPAFPVLDKRVEISIYLPNVDGETLLSETRLVDSSFTPEKTIAFLVSETVTGSQYENTRIVVPIECKVRMVWIYDSICYIDTRLETLKPETPVLPGSEQNFKNAVEKSVKENFPNITKVEFLQNGLYNRNLWTPVAINE